MAADFADQAATKGDLIEACKQGLRRGLTPNEVRFEFSKALSIAVKETNQ